jgi:hypothetical protein
MPNTNSPKIVHRGSSAAKPHLEPLGVAVKVTQRTKDLIEDARLACCLFGGEWDAAEIVVKYETMQMRVKELAEHCGALEAEHAAYRRDAIMKF